MPLTRVIGAYIDLYVPGPRWKTKTAHNDSSHTQILSELATFFQSGAYIRVYRKALKSIFVVRHAVELLFKNKQF